jgi:hypothetical protein
MIPANPPSNGLIQIQKRCFAAGGASDAEIKRKGTFWKGSTLIEIWFPCVFQI